MNRPKLRHGNFGVRLWLAACMMLLTQFACGQSEPRTWTSADGRFQTKATFVKLEDQKVFLLRADGKEVSVPLRMLSNEDREFVRVEVLRRRGEKDTTVSVAAPNRTNTAAAAGEWPRWRGINNDGKSTETGCSINGPREAHRSSGRSRALARVTEACRCRAASCS